MAPPLNLLRVCDKVCLLAAAGLMVRLAALVVRIATLFRLACPLPTVPVVRLIRRVILRCVYANPTAGCISLQ